MNRWWSAKSFKPLEGTEVLAAVLNDEILIYEIATWDSRDGGRWSLTGFEGFSEPDVRFWMDLPQLPKLSSN